MNATQSNRSSRSISSKLLACAFAMLAAGAYGAHAMAEQWTSPASEVQTSESPRAPQLESAFWVCDYVATTRGIHATQADVCSTVTDDLRNEKFGGSYEAMLQWWQENKPVEHAKVASAVSAR